MLRRCRGYGLHPHHEALRDWRRLRHATALRDWRRLRHATIAPSNLNALTFTVAGPTTEYQQFISESALTGSAGSNGTYTYTFKAPIPANAVGSWSVQFISESALTGSAGSNG